MNFFQDTTCTSVSFEDSYHSSGVLGVILLAQTAQFARDTPVPASIPTTHRPAFLVTTLLQRAAFDTRLFLLCRLVWALHHDPLFSLATARLGVCIERVCAYIDRSRRQRAWADTRTCRRPHPVYASDVVLLYLYALARRHLVGERSGHHGLLRHLGSD